MMSKAKKHILKMVLAAFFLALALVLPFLTGQIPEIGNMLCPMHIPAMLCGFVCGGPWGAVVGFAAPILRNLIFTVPRFPQCWAMAFELAVYGLSCGVLYKVLPKKIPFIYVSLVFSMLLGRIVWGLVQAFIITKFFPVPYDFTFAYFLAEGFVKAVPGMIIQIVLIPPVVMALRKQKLMVE